MQRRAGKGLAHITISSPVPNTSPGMGPDSEKTSHLNRRTLGVTNKIWIIITLFLVVVVLTQLFLPTYHNPPLVKYSTAHLKPKNYINSSEAEPNPFEFCPSFGPGDVLGAKYGSLTLYKSRLHLGSGARIQRFIHKALLGMPVTISIIGGSVSACHGAGDDPISPNCYPSRFFQWWNTVFPHPVSELTNGAMRRTNSAYFGYCNSHHIPDHTDLVILELDADDSPDQEMMDNFEVLVRSLLRRPDQPAVLVLGHFSPQVHETHGFAGPDQWHSVVAQFYDVPHISTKSVVYPMYMNDPNAVKLYYADPVLANSAGHGLIADILISYLQLQICTAWNAATGQSHDSVPLLAVDPAVAEAHGLYGGVGQKKGVAPPDKPLNNLDGEVNKKSSNLNHPPKLSIPLGRINTRPGTGRPFQEIAPYCVSANDLINPLPPSLFYGSGWLAFHPPAGSLLQLTSHYWHSSMPTSKLRIPLQIGAGDVGIYYMKEPIDQVGDGSAVECWVDDNYGGARTLENAADMAEATPVLEIIDRLVSRGSHYIECQLLGEEGYQVPDFRIVGVFAT